MNCLKQKKLFVRLGLKDSLRKRENYMNCFNKNCKIRTERLALEKERSNLVHLLIHNYMQSASYLNRYFDAWIVEYTPSEIIILIFPTFAIS